MWLVQPGSTQYWVEAGYATYSSAFSHTVQYFWADQRPSGGYNEHPLSSVASGDYGFPTYFNILYVGSNQYRVSIQGYTSGSHQYYSTNNTMQPTLIQMGQELAGSGSASAPYAAFFGRYGYTTSGGSYALPLSDASKIHSDPPYLYVSGDYYETHCC